MQYLCLTHGLESGLLVEKATLTQLILYESMFFNVSLFTPTLLLC